VSATAAAPAAARGDAIAELYGTRVRVAGVELQATDAAALAAITLFAALTVVCHARIHSPGAVLAKFLACGLLYLGATALYQRLRNRHLRFLVRTASVQFLCAELYLLVYALQLILVGSWQDAAVVRVEQAIFGVQPVVWFEGFVTPGLTEWLMFSYVVYLFLYPLLSGLIYYQRGEQAMEDFLFTGILANLACDIGFILFPVASPYYYRPVRELLTVPLDGWFFTACGEYIRHHLHSIGSSLPSAHTAVATVMWAMAGRYSRPAFYALAPVIVSLYVSTVYLRYHYASDAVAGIVVGAVAVLAAPAAMRVWNRRTVRWHSRAA
jgi:membrane-associated phospholipid phosphatase